VKPLYITGTQKDVGKTTLSLGLVHAFRRKGLNAAYTKPLGQQVHVAREKVLHDDTEVVAKLLGSDGADWPPMAVPLPAGRVEREIRDLRTDELLTRVTEHYSALAKNHDVVLIEAMGNVAAGSCLGLSAGDVARALGAKALLVAGGGIGSTIDELALCGTFLKARGADLIGAVVNKVWPEKYDRVKEATAIGLEHQGIKSFGAVPFERRLASPTMRQVHRLIDGEILCGADHLHHRALHTIVGAMEAGHLIRYIQPQTLIITPGDRTDNILVALDMHLPEGRPGPSISGLILTCGFRPEDEALQAFKESHLPVILVEPDTHAVASKINTTIFKITPEDQERIDWAVSIVAEHVDVDAIINALKE